VALPAEAHQPGIRAAVLDTYLRQAERRIVSARAELQQARKLLAEVQKLSKSVAKNRNISEAGTSSKPIVHDNFNKAQTDLWEMKAGRWEYKNGKLVQRQDGPTRAALRLKRSIPGDFVARFQFTPIAGQTWKSVGLSFDVADGNEVLVYLSAYAGGSKLQI